MPPRFETTADHILGNVMSVLRHPLGNTLDRRITKRKLPLAALVLVPDPALAGVSFSGNQRIDHGQLLVLPLQQFRPPVFGLALQPLLLLRHDLERV
jgi:hypothetical protein